MDKLPEFLGRPSYLNCGFFWNTIQDFSAMYYLSFCTKCCVVYNKILLTLEALNACK
jgi:hypothetical protein